MSSNALPSWPISFVDGFINALRWHKVASTLARSRSIRVNMFKIVLLNGLLWLLVFDYLFKDRLLFGYKYSQWTGYPLYLVCLGINSRWLDRMARATIQLGQHGVFQYTSQPTRDSQASFLSLLRMASFYLSCMLVVTLVRCIPWIGTPASLLLNCVIMGYYCFEYKWIDLGWTQAHRMAFVERHWAYFLGFGLPATLLTFFLTTLHAGAVFALVYPSFVILACVSTMKPYDSSRLPHLPVMMGVRTVNRLCQLGIDAAMGSRSSRDRYTTDSFGMNKDKGALL